MVSVVRAGSSRLMVNSAELKKGLFVVFFILGP
jgi:hypothetical protein